MNHHYLFFLIVSSAPMVVPLLVLTLGLLMLRRQRERSRGRMMDAENHATGGSVESWDAALGPSTLSELPAPRSFDTLSGRRFDD